MPRCSGCKKNHETLVEGLCKTCREGLGLLPFELPITRPPGPCHRCGDPEIIQALLRERGPSGSKYTDPDVRPLAISHGVEDTLTFWSEKKKGIHLDLEAFSGALVAYTCRRCGYTELYALSPEEIPIGPEHGTRLLKADDPPYR